ncbi:MAG: PBP1A family penicillin-binding protein [Myxococcota bacterium]|nr:PBP1A family penicillin-binding protein [Myxococcota bacterium]
MFFTILHGASQEVRDTLSRPLWDLPGHVYSGPLTLWPGLALTAEELASELRAGGYAQVDTPTNPGEFTVASGGLHAVTRLDPAVEVLVTFRDGIITSTSPSNRVDFGPVLLASVRSSENEERTPRELSDFPENLQKAVLAMEDTRFFDHGGVSIPGILRALVRNLMSDGPMQGGSTISQQLTKNLFLTPERTWTRKLNELFLTLALERELEKSEILTLYLNEVYWGQAGGVAICGADQAARTYFGKPVEHLSLSEAATLGGIISAPNRYSPLRHPEKALERRNMALGRMLATQWITPEKFERVSAEPLEVVHVPTSRRAPYAVDAVVEQIESSLGDGAIASGGLSVHTTIHPVLQSLAEQSAHGALETLSTAHPEASDAQVAVVALDPQTGNVLALVGGRNYASSQFNRAIQASRQLGSTVKPLTLVAAFEKDPDLSPSSPLLDEPIERLVDGETWSPSNYDGTYAGEVSLRETISRSRNIPAVLLAEEVGLANLSSWLQDLGLNRATALPSVSLGAFDATPMDLARAYSIFPASGEVPSVQLLDEVRSPGGDILNRSSKTTTRLVSPRSAALATSVLETVMESGTGASAATYGLHNSVAGKSGTTDDGRDAWFVGFTPDLVVAVWVGRDGGEPLGLTGSSAALPVWSQFIASSGRATGTFPMPESVVEAETCAGVFLQGECTSCVVEVFTAGTEPLDGCEPPGVLSSIWDMLGDVSPFSRTLEPEADTSPPERKKRKRRWRR